MEATEVLGTLTTEASSVKAVVEAIKAARDKAKGSTEAMATLIEAQELALSLQSNLFNAKEQALALQEENRQLRAQIRQHEEGALERGKYERRKIGPDTVVVLKADPEAYLCATCFEADRLTYLTALPRSFRSFGTHRCPVCKSQLTLR